MEIAKCACSRQINGTTGLSISCKMSLYLVEKRYPYSRFLYNVRSKTDLHKLGTVFPATLKAEEDHWSPGFKGPG